MQIRFAVYPVNSWMDDQPFDAAICMRLIALVFLSTLALTACSKAPSSVVAHAANAIGQRLMQPLVQKTASNQAKQMAALLSDKPACEVFKKRLLAAGEGSPYEGATQWKLAHTQKDACAIGCCK